MEVSTFLMLPSLFILAASATVIISLPLCHLMRLSEKVSNEIEEGSEESVTEQASSEEETSEDTGEDEDTDTGSETGEEGNSDDEKYIDVECNECCNIKASEYLILELSNQLSKLGVTLFMTVEDAPPNENWVKLLDKESLAEIFRIVKMKYNIH